MFTDPPADTLSVWTGLAVASVALTGVVLGLPTGAPDATDPARTVDSVAASPYDAAATATFPTRTRLELRPDGLDRCRAGSCSHVTFAFGPVVPVRADSALGAVLRGAAPNATFESPAAFRDAVDRTRTRRSVVVTTAELHARHVTWGGVDVTLVGA